MANVESVVQKFLSSINYKEPVLIKKNYDSRTITIYCCHPGILIGRCGQDVERLEKALKEKTVCFDKVRFEETDEYILPVQNWNKIWDDRAKARAEMNKY